jgi:hypothetical protein
MPETTPKNKTVFLVFAVSRSGHHAVMDWIYNQFNNPKVFLNYVKYQDASFDNRTQYYANDKKYFRNLNANWEKYGVLEERLKEYSVEDVAAKEILGNDKNLLMLNFENKSVSSLDQSIEDFAKQFGENTKVVPIIIARDIFNYLASKMKMGRYFFPERNLFAWKDHVRECLGLTNYLPNKVCINYNKWCVDMDYRKEVAEKLGVDTFIPEWNEVSSFGGGSSFDILKFKDNAKQMKTDERWKTYEHDEEYLSYLQDKELTDLSERYFGHIEGTERLFN